mgnify:FL=1
MKPLKRLPLLPQVLIAIVCGIVFGQFLPESVARIFVTFNSLFGNFLSFAIPLIIIGLVTPAICDMGKGAGRLLLITVLIAYGSTLFSGFLTFFTCKMVYPSILPTNVHFTALSNPGELMLQPYITISMPPLMDVMTALLISFTVGLGLAYIDGKYLMQFCFDFKAVVERLIVKVIVPLLPYHIFGLFLNMAMSGEVMDVLDTFVRVIVVMFALTIVVLLIQFCIAGAICRRNPLKALKTMFPAYMTAVGTSSSVATIPVTLAQTLKNGVREEVASFTVPLCATIHLAGSILQLVACAMALVMMCGQDILLVDYFPFILVLGVIMIAAPGVPGGAVMASLGVFQTMLGFDETFQALMIALYIAVDSFGTACNVTGDGAVALVIDKLAKK